MTDELPLLTIDERERERIQHVCVSPEYTFNVKTLPVGDYLLGFQGGAIEAFEFKTPSDFLGSVISGRVFQQVRELDLNFPGRAHLVICGSLQEARYSRPEWRFDAALWATKEASYYGALWSILEKGEVKVIQLPDLASFVKLLESKAKRLKRGEKHGERPMLTLKSGDRTAAQEAEDVLCAVSGIGRAAARGLLGHFGSIEKVVAADVKQLAQAPEIGKVRAEHLASVLRGVHVPLQ